MVADSRDTFQRRRCRRHILGSVIGGRGCVQMPEVLLILFGIC